MRVALLFLVAAAVHVTLGLVTHHHHEVGIDSTVFDIIQPLRGRVGLHVARVVTEIGSYPFAATIGVGAAIFAARRGDRHAAVALVVGIVLVLVLDGILKHQWDRPRPLLRYYDPQGHSYPSGHSTYSIIWIAAAMVTGRRALILGAVLVAVTIGASRLYLHVHYVTDVLGGFALGTAVFAPVLARIPR
jgi:undecaprenyl-diphosphatase